MRHRVHAPYRPFFAIVPEILPKAVAGKVMALINTFGAMGGFAGSWLVGWLQALTGNARAGFFAMSVSLFVSAGITLCLRTKKPEGTQN
jgi:MFS-type transporter involved in bile tolerance (Atg22 family)